MNISLGQSSYNRLTVILLVIGIYCLINLALPRLPNTFITTYVLQPIVWGLLAWAVLVLPKYKSAAKLKVKSAIIQLALMTGFFQILLYVIGGLFSSFGKSPYSFAPLGVLTNLFFVGSILIGMELSRAWLINHLGKHHTFLALAFVTLLYTLLCIPLTRIMGLDTMTESVEFLNSTGLPLLAENLLASFLALLAGPLASIAYRGILQSFWWFLPVLPDLPWVFKGLIGTAVPIIALAVVNSLYSSQAQRSKVKRTNEGSLMGWIITSIAAVLIIWFSVGLFPIHPALVASGSMQPTMDAGDVVIIAKVSAAVIKPGDIIQFRKEERVTVMHRVIEVHTTEGAEYFITKGDANDEPDTDPVMPENVVGKVIFTVRKVGWVSILVKGFFTG
ncbi:signal peptidase I [Chloroflexota bacterium]